MKLGSTNTFEDSHIFWCQAPEDLEKLKVGNYFKYENLFIPGFNGLMLNGKLVQIIKKTNKTKVTYNLLKTS